MRPTSLRQSPIDPRSHFPLRFVTHNSISCADCLPGIVAPPLNLLLLYDGTPLPLPAPPLLYPSFPSPPLLPFSFLISNSISLLVTRTSSPPTAPLIAPGLIPMPTPILVPSLSPFFSCCQLLKNNVSIIRRPVCGPYGGLVFCIVVRYCRSWMHDRSDEVMINTIFVPGASNRSSSATSLHTCFLHS